MSFFSNIFHVVTIENFHMLLVCFYVFFKNTMVLMVIQIAEDKLRKKHVLLWCTQIGNFVEGNKKKTEKRFSLVLTTMYNSCTDTSILFCCHASIYSNRKAIKIKNKIKTVYSIFKT